MIKHLTEVVFFRTFVYILSISFLNIFKNLSKKVGSAIKNYSEKKVVDPSLIEIA